MAVTKSNDSPTKNYAVMSPLHPETGTFSKGNLTAVTDGTDGSQPVGSIAFDSQDSAGYYFIMRPTTTSSTIGAFAVGVATVDHANDTPTNDATNAGSWFFNCGNGNVTNTSGIANGTWDSGGNGGISLNHYVQVAVKAGKIYFGVNNTWYDSSDGTFANAGEAFDNLTGFVVPMFQHAHASAGTVEVQFGETTFTYAAPTGFKEITAANLYSSAAPAIPDGNNHMQTTIHSGNSSSQTITQRTRFTGDTAGFTPDWVIVKDRNFGNGANAFDSVRGSDKGLATFDSGAEDTNSDGITFSSSSGKGTIAFTGAGNTGDLNNTGRTYVAWHWRAGGAPTADNTDGQTPTNNSVFRDGVASTTAFPSADIYPTRASINSTAGFSIVSYTGNATDGATLAHGLSTTPGMAWFRKRNTSQWTIHHNGLTNGISGGRGAQLDVNDAETNTFGAGYVDTFNANTCTLQTGGSSDANVNDNAAYIAYFFAEIPGYSKFGSYEGNGDASDGPLVNIGFKPQWLLCKGIDQSAQSWLIYDNVREPNNLKDLDLTLDLPETEDASMGSNGPDFLSNGFKFQSSGTSQGNLNVDAKTFIYMAFAEHPFAGETPGTSI